MSTGWASGIVTAKSGPIPARVDLNAPCQQVKGTVSQWFNTQCYSQPPIGEDGNAEMFGVFGPNFINLDSSLVKNTKLSERYGLQFRAEFFNILNHTNFRNPGQPMSFVFSSLVGTPSFSATACQTTPSTCSATLSTLGQLFLTQNGNQNGSGRQIQFGMKLTF